MDSENVIIQEEEATGEIYAWPLEESEVG